MRIKNYIKDVNIVANDKWIGSDANNQGQTKNFTPIALADYYNHNQVIDSVYLKFTYQTLNPGEERADGTISFESEIGSQVAFSSISTFLLSKKSLKGNNVSDFEMFLNNNKIIISKGENVNEFGLFKVTSITDYTDDNFYIVSLDYIGGNGYMFEDKDYCVSLLSYDEGITSSLTLQQVTDNGNVTTNSIEISQLQTNGDVNVGKQGAGASVIINSLGLNGTNAVIKADSLTAQREHQLPDADGTLALTSNIPSLSGYATESWVTSQGYITSSALSPYLTISSASSTYFPKPTGNTSQYIKGDGSLGVFPTIPTVGTWGALNYPTWISGTPFVKMTAAGTFSLDTNTYLTSSNLSGYVPYTGATTNLNLGSYWLLSTVVQTTGVVLDGWGAPGIEKGLADGMNIFGDVSRDSTSVINFSKGKREANTPLLYLKLSDGTLNYSSDVSSYYTARTLIDKGYADSHYVFTSPLTTKGDLFTYSTTNARLPIGLDTQVLIADSTQATGMKWGSNTAPTQLGYYGAWQDNVTQTAAVSNTGYPMIFRTTDLSNGVSVVTNGTNLTRITFANTGIYNLQFSSQFQNIGNSQEDITIWLRLNGVDVPGTSGFISIPARKSAGTGNEGHIVSGWNYVLNVVGGQYYELVWSTSNASNVTMQYYAAGSPPPSAASVIMTVMQQSGIMAGTGLTAINSLTGAVQTLTTGTSGTDFAISSSGTTHTFNIPTASATNTGKLSSTDWSTFNGKQNALGYTPENVSNKSDSYTSSSSTTYSSTKALVDGLATKQALLGYTPYRYVNTTQTTVTGTLSETVVATSIISGNTFNSNDVMKQLFKTIKGVTLSNVTMRVKINTSNTLSGATTIATYTFLTTSTIALMQRTFDLSGGNLYGLSSTSSQITDVIGISSGGSSTTYNTANTLYVFFTLQLGNNLDSCTFNMANITN